uniref:Iduronate 2-sulfatase n=1 Tax=Oncorhynchus kisutch TaxID=8019 RepID=A0A8C7F8T2_ONCKI
LVADDMRPTLGYYGDPVVKQDIDHLASKRNQCVHQCFKFKGLHHYPAANHSDDYPYSWSVPPYHPPSFKYDNRKVCKGIDGQLHVNLLCSVNVSEPPLGTLPDMESAEAVRLLKSTRDSEKHLFLAVGFHKPHIPFRIPQEVLKLYPLDKMTLEFQVDYTCTLLEKKCNLKPKRIRQQYYVSVMYLDSQVGMLSNTLDDLGLAKDNDVVFTSDHGKHGEWAKYSNFDVATRLPLMFYIFPYIDVFGPAQNVNELLDVFPTVSYLAGLKPPHPCPDNSFDVELCTLGRQPGLLLQAPRLQQGLQPATLLSWDYRFTLWVGFDPASFQTDLVIHALELYLMERDPGQDHNLYSASWARTIIS